MPLSICAWDFYLKRRLVCARKHKVQQPRSLACAIVKQRYLNTGPGATCIIPRAVQAHVVWVVWGIPRLPWQ